MWPQRARNGTEHEMAIVNHSPTAAEYRRMAEIRDRWHAALTGLAVTALVILVFWLLPLPARATG